MVFTLFGLLTRRASHDGCRDRCCGKLSFLYPSNKLLLQFSWTQFPVNHNKWPSKRPTLTRDAIQYETKRDFSTSPHNIQNKRFWQFVQKFFGYANRLLQQLSGWLVSDDLGGEDAGCGGPGLRLWGRLDVLPNSLKRLWRQLMVEKWTFNSQATALVDIPAVSMPIARSLKTCNICGIVLCDKTAHLRVTFYCGQPKRHLCCNHAV